MRKNHLIILIHAVNIIITIGIQGALAQSGTIDATFNPTDIGFGFGNGPNANVISSCIQSDGKIIIGGSFTRYNGISRNRIARINPDGNIDESFNPGTGANGGVESISVHNDGKIIVAGGFTEFNGVPRNSIARLNVDGSLDESFDTGIGANNTIEGIYLQNDGKIIIVGYFTSYNGVTRNHIARLNTDGSLDESFDPGTGANSVIGSVSIQSDGKIIIGGYFTSYNGISRNRIARLNADGSLDESFNPGTGANNGINSIAIQSDGKIIIGGYFTSYNGTSRNRIARLNTDGSLDESFNPGTGANGTVTATSIQSDGKIIIGGLFTAVNNESKKYIVRLNADGSIDETFNAGGNGPSHYVWTSAIQNDGKIIIGGNFSTYNLVVKNCLARLNADGTLDTNFIIGTGADAEVNTVSIQNDGKIIISGEFTSYNGTLINRTARLNTDGTLDESFDPGEGVNGKIYSTSIQGDGKIVIGGEFIDFNGTPRNNIARLNTDGSLDNTFNPGTGANDRVAAIAIQNDGKIIIGGYFTEYDGISKNYVARLNQDGTLDETFNNGLGADGWIKAISIQSDGKIIIAGSFLQFNETTRNYIARLNTDGTLDESFDPGAGPDDEIEAISVQSDGKIIICGDFTTYNGTSRNGIARLNPDGTLDESFDPGTGADYLVKTVSIQNDGKIIIGGEFTEYNGTDINYFACLNTDGTLDETFNTGTGPSYEIEPFVAVINSIAIQADGNIIIGGQFTSFNGTGRNRIARIFVCPSPDTVFVEVSACNSYTWPLNGQTYTISGSYTQTLTNAMGCDSIVILNLTINTVDITITNNSPILTANASGASYQWLDCNDAYEIIPGEIAQSFFATNNGNYAVQITQNGCVDTSECVSVTNIGFKENSFETSINLYPNPSMGTLNIDLGDTYHDVTVILLNELGQEIFRKMYEIINIFQIDIPEKRGNYQIIIRTKTGKISSFKVIRQ